VFPYLVLGVAVLAGLLLAGRWFATTDPKVIVRALKWILLGTITSVALFFALTGRLSWAFFTLPALLPWFMRLRSVARMAKNFSRMASASQGGGSGQTSDVETRFLRIVLDHDSGQMHGDVIEGAFAGRTLSEMALGELLSLLAECQGQDAQSVQVLEAYLDREQPDWRAQAGTARTGDGTSDFGGGAMTRQEALQILGLQPDASEDDVKEAHHRLIAGIHPDHGGSTYLAAKINQAKDTLLKPS